VSLIRTFELATLIDHRQRGNEQPLLLSTTCTFCLDIVFPGQFMFHSNLRHEPMTDEQTWALSRLGSTPCWTESKSAPDHDFVECRALARTQSRPRTGCARLPECVFGIAAGWRPGTLPVCPCKDCTGDSLSRRRRKSALRLWLGTISRACPSGMHFSSHSGGRSGHGG